MSILNQLTKSLVQQYADKLEAQEAMKVAEALQFIAEDKKYNKFGNYFPDTGRFRRELYPKHMMFFNAGEEYIERGFIAANRVGKTESGAYEVTCHATGKYPDWWTGFRIDRPCLIWVGGDTGTTVRDIIQKKLVGDDITNMGGGMLPKESIIAEKCKTRRNVPDSLETIKIKHISGGESTIVLKTYEQGRIAWQGTEVDFIWMDEECPEDVYSEALIRIMTTKGRIITTFTPLQGLTELVLGFLENSQETDEEDPVHVTTVGWDDVPHLDEETKRKILKRTPPNLQEARSKGIPTVGEGLVYPIDLKLVTTPDFMIPKHYKRLGGLDVGWNNTGAVWLAHDTESDIMYVYSEYKMSHAEPTVHAKAIKARGSMIRMEIDPAARGRSQIDGEQLFKKYKQEEKVNVIPANNAVEAGIFEIWERFISGRLKIFASAQGLLRELSLYHRDEKGKIVKKHDHLLDAMRYAINAPMSHWVYLMPEKSKMDQKRGEVIQLNNMGACT